MNKSIIAAKESVVNEITANISASQSVVVVEYRGLNVEDLQQLRRELRKEGGEIKVYKNTLVSRAIETLGLGNGLEADLNGPNATVFSKKDCVTAPKILSKFAKKNDKLVIKGGIVEGKIVSAADVKVVATLPNKEGLLSMLLSCLNAPIRNFACAVKAIADKQQENA